MTDTQRPICPPHDFGMLGVCVRCGADERKSVVRADADYVLRWLRQTNAPQNIVGLQERVLRSLS